MHHHHQEQHFTGSQLVRDIVIGMSDGLTVPFALAAGLTGAVQDTGIIITAGLAEIAAGSIAMGLGGYLAGKTEVEHYDAELKREYEEVELFPEKEKQEVKDVFEEYGLSKQSTTLLVDELTKDKDKWVNFMMRFELGLEKPDINQARKSALAIGIAYIIGGIVPLTSYFFANTAQDGLAVSCGITIICLFVFGYFKSKVIGQPPLAGAVRVTAIGALAAGTAYFVASLIS
ncbi:MAG: iron transporter [Bacteroidetes bacterium]|nr:MAG: iron transporter [Bacteroidota bacterium]